MSETVTDDQIRRLFYVKDDVVIANFLGIKPARVADLRANKPPEKPMPTYVCKAAGGTFLGNEGAMKEAQTSACDQHLKALLRYGLRNDRDLGMGAERFYAAAAQYGIAA